MGVGFQGSLYCYFQNEIFEYLEYQFLEMRLFFFELVLFFLCCSVCRMNLIYIMIFNLNEDFIFSLSV